ncbi:MAG: DUF465 domain-containing protein [Hyphomicrobiales bacterium]|nr:DUF465 domain-containing protein [Hyphomicrobiales bacterium]
MNDEKRIFEQLNQLTEEHEMLDRTIHDMHSSNPYVDQLSMQRLKKKKLFLKEEIAKLKAQLYPDIIA